MGIGRGLAEGIRPKKCAQSSRDKNVNEGWSKTGQIFVSCATMIKYSFSLVLHQAVVDLVEILGSRNL